MRALLRLLLCLLALLPPAAIATTADGGPAAVPGVRLPAELRARHQELAARGRAALSWFGLRIYDAALWAAPAANPPATQTHALEIRYARSIRGRQLVDTSLDEIDRLGYADPARVDAWRSALTRVLPDVAAGDTLVGLHRPGQGASFWHGERHTGDIDDAELARAFFAIWLDERSREPELRARLLGLAPSGHP